MNGKVMSDLVFGGVLTAGGVGTVLFVNDWFWFSVLVLIVCSGAFLLGFFIRYKIENRKNSPYKWKTSG